MGRPIKKIFIGERGAGSAGGEGLASVTLGGTNNSTGYTGGDALTIGAPDLVGGVQATGTVTIYADGALLEGVTTETSITGTGVDGLGGGAAVYTDVAIKSTSGSGVGATFTITKDNTNGVTDYSDISSIVITAIGSGFALSDTVTISGADLGGVDTTNDLTFTISTFVTNGTISGTTITEAGSGYTSAPTVTAATGTQGTLTLTGVLSTGSAAVIAAEAYVTTTNESADMIAQKGSTTYRVETATDGVGECSLVAATPSAAGEMAIEATDSAGGTYWVLKLYNNTVLLEQNTGSQFANGTRVKWAKDGTPVLNDSVAITS